METDAEIIKWGADEIERLNARHEGDKKVVQASEDCARKHQERAERLLDENSLKDDLLWAWLGCYQKNHAPDEWLVGDTRQAIKDTSERVSTEQTSTQNGNKDTYQCRHGREAAHCKICDDYWDFEVMQHIEQCRHIGDTRTEGGMTYCEDCDEPL